MLLVQSEQFVVLHRTRPCTEDIAIGQHNLHTALRLRVLTVGSIADTTVHGVSQDGPPSDGRYRRPELQPPTLDLLEEIEEGDPRLDDRIAVFLVDLDDLLHALQVEHNGPLVNGAGPTVPQILATGNHPQGYLVSVGELDDRLDLFDAVGPDGAAGAVLCSEREDVAVGLIPLSVLDCSVLVIPGNVCFSEQTGSVVKEGG